MSRYIHHVSYQVQILDCHCVQPAVVDAKLESSVRLWDKKNRWGPFRLGRFDKVHGEHSISLLVFKFSRPRSFVTQSWLYLLVIRLLKFDSVLHCLNQAKVFVSHALKLCKHVDKYEWICRVFFGLGKLVVPVGLRMSIVIFQCFVATYLLVSALRQLKANIITCSMEIKLLAYCQNWALIFQYGSFSLACMGNFGTLGAKATIMNFSKLIDLAVRFMM